MVTGLVRGCDLGPGCKSAERETIGNALRCDQNVWRDAVMLDGEHLSGASEAGLHFVRNKQNAVLVEHFLDLTKIIRRRNDDATFAEHRFGDERSNVA